MKLLTKIESIDPNLTGAYVLEFRVIIALGLRIGKIGLKVLKAGWWYYVGSARRGLKSRVSRHIRGPVKIHWHIDYVTKWIKPESVWLVVTGSDVERELADAVGSVCDSGIPGFGCSDRRGVKTHMFYSKTRRNFKEVISTLGQVEHVVVR